MEYLFAYYVFLPLFWAGQALIVLALLAVLGAVVFRRRAGQPVPRPSPAPGPVDEGSGSSDGSGGGTGSRASRPARRRSHR
jgi:hypothetical protein